jgi:hypothetical protein
MFNECLRNRVMSQKVEEGETRGLFILMKSLDAMISDRHPFSSSQSHRLFEPFLTLLPPILEHSLPPSGTNLPAQRTSPR